MAKKKSHEQKLAAAHANGYKRRAHAETDKKTGLQKYKDDVLALQDWTLDNYVT
jgi:hypothetical protein